MVPVEACFLQQRVGIAEVRGEGSRLLPHGNHPLVPPVGDSQGVELRPGERSLQRCRGWERREREEVVAALRERRVADDEDTGGAVRLRAPERDGAAPPDESRRAARGYGRGLEPLVAGEGCREDDRRRSARAHSDINLTAPEFPST